MYERRIRFTAKAACGVAIKLCSIKLKCSTNNVPCLDHEEACYRVPITNMLSRLLSLRLSHALWAQHLVRLQLLVPRMLSQLQLHMPWHIRRHFRPAVV